MLLKLAFVKCNKNQINNNNNNNNNDNNKRPKKQQYCRHKTVNSSLALGLNYFLALRLCSSLTLGLILFLFPTHPSFLFYPNLPYAFTDHHL